MRRLEHLSGVQGMEIRVVIAQPPCSLFEHHKKRFAVCVRLALWPAGRQALELILENLGRTSQQLGDLVLSHSDFSPYHNLSELIPDQ